MTTSYSERPGELTLKLNPKETCLIVIDMRPMGVLGGSIQSIPK